MATGPEHYRASEALLSSVTTDRRLDAEGQERFLALAQVHATLALAAATALNGEGGAHLLPTKDATAWFDAAAECRKEGAA